MRSYEFGDPARVLEIRGEDCDNCVSLGEWHLGGSSVTACTNEDAPQKKRENAPASRCFLWRHKQGEKI